MNGLAIASIICSLFFEQLSANVPSEYELKRNNLIETDLQRSIGSKVILTEQEQVVNNILMRWKKVNTDRSFNNRNRINFSEPFFIYRDILRQSRGYQIIRWMPKGAALHVHSTFMVEPMDLLKLTYEEHLYACISFEDLKLFFSESSPKLHCAAQWILVSDVRSNHYYEVTDFDEVLLDHLTVGLEKYYSGLVADKKLVSDRLVQTKARISSFISYRPVQEKMIYKSLQNFYDDNIMYMEIRTGLYNLYELDGTVHDQFYSAIVYHRVAKTFMSANPDFVGIKLIITAERSSSMSEVINQLVLARKVKRMLPELFAGFDLVGPGKLLIEFMPSLWKVKDELDFFFHAGETYQYGTPRDENLFDAIMLGTKRIGHGDSVIKHPMLVKAVYQNDIAIEANVISHSLLSVVRDLGNHPLPKYLSLGLPVVLSTSDPGVWGAKPLSDDFYVAFVAIASIRADLGMLKQLAINSIRYSALDEKGKTKLFRIFKQKWHVFIQKATKLDNRPTSCGPPYSKQIKKNFTNV